LGATGSLPARAFSVRPTLADKLPVALYAVNYWTGHLLPRSFVMLSEAMHLAPVEEPGPSLRCSENVYLKPRFGCYWQLVCQCSLRKPALADKLPVAPNFVLRGCGAAACAAQDDSSCAAIFAFVLHSQVFSLICPREWFTA